MDQELINILEELRNTSSSKKKMQILTDNKDNLLLQEILKLTYDTVNYNFYITPKNLTPQLDNSNKNDLTSILETFKSELVSRKVTGNNAKDLVNNLLSSSTSKEVLDTAIMVLNRDLRINIGKSGINKVWNNLVKDTPYMRCGVFSEKLASKIEFPAIVQLKADGRFSYAIVRDETVTFEARSGEVKEFPLLEKEFMNLPDGAYVGELLVEGLNERSEANGLINSDNPPHDKIYMKTWDLIPLDEYDDASASNKSLKRIPYGERFNNMKENIKNLTKISAIDSYEVNNIQEVYEITSKLMNQGFEGTVFKDKNLLFKDSTSNQQLKLKVEIELEVRITGFIEGKKGTKRESTFGSMTFATDDGKIVGSTSGFNDAQLKDFNGRRQELIGKVFSVKCNNITKARDNDYYALSHPVFVELRDDKDYTDTIERAFELKQMALTITGTKQVEVKNAEIVAENGKNEMIKDFIEMASSKDEVQKEEAKKFFDNLNPITQDSIVNEALNNNSIDLSYINERFKRLEVVKSDIVSKVLDSVKKTISKEPQPELF